MKCIRFFLNIVATFVLLIPFQIAFASNKPIVYFLPHQDDEMFLAGSIVRAVRAGKSVYVFIATDGEASHTYEIINSRLAHEYHARALSKQAFVQARNKEVVISLERLGVPFDHIHFANPGGEAGSDHPLYKDRELTVASAQKILTDAFNSIGDGEYITLTSDSKHRQHPDHAALRIALENFSLVTTKKYFSEQPNFGKEVILSTNEQKTKNHALLAYYRWDPAKGHFAIGVHSVKKRLDFWRKIGKEYMID